MILENFIPKEVKLGAERLYEGSPFLKMEIQNKK